AKSLNLEGSSRYSYLFWAKNASVVQLVFNYIISKKIYFVKNYSFGLGKSIRVDYITELTKIKYVLN
ncbi:MAG: hypothetical protein ACP5OB_06795, partial [Candidatus Ratteibacteria bacterium]